MDVAYIDSFCGRTPSSVLEKHYLDYTPERLKEIYDEAGLTVREQARGSSVVKEWKSRSRLETSSKQK